MVSINFSNNWAIQPAESHPVSNLALKELQSYLCKITGLTAPLPGGTAAGALKIQLQAAASGTAETCAIYVTPAQIQFQAGGPNGLLYGVYAFLEGLGCRWPAPGLAAERIPVGTRFDLPETLETGAPAFPGRCLILGHHAFLEQAEDWIIWAARQRLNTLFAHTIPGPMAFGAAPIAQWERKREKAIALARERGMTFELGGHGLMDLLPRELFKQNPAMFRQKGGKRLPDHNFCPSSPQAKAVVQQNARAWFARFPEADVYHVWADDIVGGGWCECPACQGFNSSEQLLMATNWLAEVLAEVKPGAQISFLAYHDTEAAPVKVQALPNVCVLWAPRMRCYAHSLDDPACPVNGSHYPQLAEAQLAAARQAGASPARIFEYYLDGILFKSVLPPFPDILQKDLQYYHAAGFHTIQALMTGDHPWVNAQINTWLFARLAWDPAQDLPALLAEYVAYRFGRAIPELVDYYLQLENAFGMALDLHPEQIKLAFDDSPLLVLSNPPADMGDPSYAPLEVLQQKALRNKSILAYLEVAQRSLAAAKSQALPGEWAAEVEAFKLIDAWLRFDYYRVAVLAASRANQPRESIAQAWQAANQAYQDALGWADEHIPDPRYRINFQFMHEMLWGARMKVIQANYLSSWPVRLWRQAGTILRMLSASRKVRGLYN